jgi:hypothetical protein
VIRTLLRLAAAGALAGAAGRALARLAVRGALTLDTGIGRTTRPLGPLIRPIAAPPEVVFEVIAGPYLGRTPRAFRGKLEVWERGSDMVLAAHFTLVGSLTARTLETVRFERPSRVSFRLVRGPVPHLAESFELRPVTGGTELEWHGELAADFWLIGRWWGSRVARAWEETVRRSVDAFAAEAERRERR